MKLSFGILVVIVLTILGCGGLGGQGVVVKLVAERGSTIEKVEVNINIVDGGTDLTPLYKPTTQPSD